MHRFFLPPLAFLANPILFPEEQTRQMRQVLRLRPGDAVVALDGAGQQARVRLVALEGAHAVGEALERGPAAGEPRTHVTLYVGLTQREKMEWIFQKAVEIGAAAIAPLLTERSLVRAWDAGDARKLERWRKIAQEAAEQSGRGRIPAVHEPRRLAAALAEAPQQHESCLFAWEAERGRSLRAALRSADGAPARVALFIGPEGGFSPAEAAAAHAAGVAPVSLGPRILRMETAALAALALVLYELGDLEG